jgi:hypothetical protein
VTSTSYRPTVCFILVSLGLPAYCCRFTKAKATHYRLAEDQTNATENFALATEDIQKVKEY